jgi:hypothetical protein
MTRKRYSKRQIVELWTEGQGKCWRCEQPIRHEIYGEGWVLGHVGKAHWCGGVIVAPEHTACNAEDGKVQSTLAAKSIRIQARAIGVKRPKRVMPGSRASKWKKKLNGQVVLR